MDATARDINGPTDLSKGDPCGVIGLMLLALLSRGWKPRTRIAARRRERAAEAEAS